MTKQEYADLLKHPMWQRKRLEALEAADFSCSLCGNKEKTLNVHHRKYRSGAKPWEYELDELEVLCEDCHLGFHAIQKKMDEVVRFLWKKNPPALQRLLGYALASRSGECVDEEEGAIVAVEGNLELAIGVSDWLGKFEFQDGTVHGGAIYVLRKKEFDVGQLSCDLDERLQTEMVSRKQSAAG